MPLSVNGRCTATVSVGTATVCFVGNRTHGATLGTMGAVLAGWQIPQQQNAQVFAGIQILLIQTRSGKVPCPRNTTVI